MTCVTPLHVTTDKTAHVLRARAYSVLSARYHVELWRGAVIVFFFHAYENCKNPSRKNRQFIDNDRLSAPSPTPRHTGLYVNYAFTDSTSLCALRLSLETVEGIWWWIRLVLPINAHEQPSRTLQAGGRQPSSHACRAGGPPQAEVGRAANTRAGRAG